MCLTGLKSWIREAPVSRILFSVLSGAPLALLVVGMESIFYVEVDGMGWEGWGWGLIFRGKEDDS